MIDDSAIAALGGVATAAVAWRCMQRRRCVAAKAAVWRGGGGVARAAAKAAAAVLGRRGWGARVWEVPSWAPGL